MSIDVFILSKLLHIAKNKVLRHGKEYKILRPAGPGRSWNGLVSFDPVAVAVMRSGTGLIIAAKNVTFQKPSYSSRSEKARNRSFKHCELGNKIDR
jgi:hypothetical protein